MQTGRTAEDFRLCKDWIKVNGYKGVPDWLIKEKTGFDIRLIRRALRELDAEPKTLEEKLNERAEIERLAALKPWRIL